MQPADDNGIPFADVAEKGGEVVLPKIPQEQIVEEKQIEETTEEK